MDLDQIPFFFIVCKGRSGSTLLQGILNAHPHIKVPLESRLFMFLHKKYTQKTNWTTIDLVNFYRDLFLEVEFLKAWRINGQRLKERILTEPKDTNFGRLLKIVFLEANISDMPSKEIQLIGNKKPGNTLFIKQIKRVFPQAKFIHLIRDPRDSCLSSVKKLNSKSYDFAARRWLFFNEAIEKQAVLFPEDFIKVFYENLVSTPQSEVKRICRFLEIPFSDKMLQTERRQVDLSHFSKVEKRKILQVFSNNKHEINTKAVGKYKKGMTPSQIKKVERICQPLMVKYDYGLDYPEASVKISWIKAMQFWLSIHKTKFYYATPLWVRKSYRSYKNCVLKISS